MPGQPTSYQSSHTEVTKTGYFSRIGNSFKGIVFGLILFIGAFAVLYNAEGRVDKSEIAKTAITIDANQVDASANGKLVTFTGDLTSSETIGDTFIEPGDYIALYRHVEVYAWQESSQSETKTNVGGSQTTTTTYSYSQDWTSNPTPASNFSAPDAPSSNASLTLEPADLYVDEAKVGVYKINPESISLPTTRDLILNKDIVNQTEGFRLMDPKYMFKGKGSMSSPQIGDLRISYTMVPANQEVSAFGKLNGDRLDPFIGEENTQLYMLSSGTSDQAVASLAKAHSTMGWVWRLVGFLMMWFGLGMILAPISVLLDVLPFLGSISRGAVSLATFLVSLMLTIITIIIAKILHSFIAVLGLGILATIILVVIFLRKKGTPKQS